MITRQFSLNQMPEYAFEQDFSLDKIVFFDIETTGFVAEETYLYLIGCAYYENSSFHLIQWFSEGIQEEAELLTSFFKFIKNYDILLHYNGSGFDLPYLRRKCSLLNLNYSFDHIISIDIYKKILPYKKIFNLKSLKLKSLEIFLGIERQDVFNGGELIPIYQSYLGKKSLESLRNLRKPRTITSSDSEAEQLLTQLLLHNEDDIRGLLLISQILNYVDLFEKPIRILQAGIKNNVFEIIIELTAKLPVSISFGDNLIHLTACDNISVLKVSIYEGELKYFYENYRDYYYLPAEDYAIHKSVAAFVDKEYKVKAKPSTCYVKKPGIFVPQFSTVLTPCLKTSYQDKISFLEVHTDLLLQEENLEKYVAHILEYLINSKKS